MFKKEREVKICINANVVWNITFTLKVISFIIKISLYFFKVEKIINKWFLKSVLKIRTNFIWNFFINKHCGQINKYCYLQKEVVWINKINLKMRIKWIWSFNMGRPYNLETI